MHQINKTGQENASETPAVKPCEERNKTTSPVESRRRSLLSAVKQFTILQIQRHRLQPRQAGFSPITPFNKGAKSSINTHFYPLLFQNLHYPECKSTTNRGSFSCVVFIVYRFVSLHSRTFLRPETHSRFHPPDQTTDTSARDSSTIRAASIIIID